MVHSFPCSDTQFARGDRARNNVRLPLSSIQVFFNRLFFECTFSTWNGGPIKSAELIAYNDAYFVVHTEVDS